jgi:hypothetical protein
VTALAAEGVLVGFGVFDHSGIKVTWESGEERGGNLCPSRKKVGESLLPLVRSHPRLLHVDLTLQFGCKRAKVLSMHITCIHGASATASSSILNIPKVVTYRKLSGSLHAALTSNFTLKSSSRRHFAPPAYQPITTNCVIVDVRNF